ncbi:MAG: alkaline phosphatase D family protein [Acidobacteria bacterium]|nr:alkaline phosphatase D family protein [Acidobacteriota bacterium]
MRRIPRRLFLSTSAAAAAALPVFGRARLDAAQNANPVFRHGVASGDPLSDRVLLWTRVSVSTDSAPVRWVLALDAKLARIVARGEVSTGAERDYTVKVDVAGLTPATTYYYRFEAAGEQSAVARTRTLPARDASRVRLGVVSCSNLPFGYFNVYAALAARADLDAVLHLGDYIYEYANGQYGDGTALGRVPAPDAEIVALADYRARHAQYKADPDCQAVHRQHPFIVIWDDHELANNTWRDGALNHTAATEGEWVARRNAAVQAFFEWMPIREDAAALSPRIYRTLRIGTLADLVLLDTRLVGRDLQVASRDDVAAIEAPGRHLLGAAQEAWLAGELAESKRRGARWQVIGQQVMFAPQSAPGRPTSNVDSWDGYRAAREHVFDMIEQQRLDSVAVLTGDVHSAWAYDVPRRPFDAYDPGTGRGSLAVEFVGTSISSPSNLGAGPNGEQQLADLRAARPHLHYVDGRRRGYFVLDLTRERLQADYFAMRTVIDRTADETFVHGFAAPAGQMHLTTQASPVPPASAPDPAPA